jgi:hypothetical protein
MTRGNIISLIGALTVLLGQGAAVVYAFAQQATAVETLSDRVELLEDEQDDIYLIQQQVGVLDERSQHTLDSIQRQERILERLEDRFLGQ